MHDKHDLNNEDVLGASRPSLYRVTPEGVPGAPEAMLSWMLALSHAHCANPRLLLSRIMAESIQYRNVWGGSTFFERDCSTANGLGVYARMFVDLLLGAAGTKECRDLTLLSLTGLLAHNGEGLLAKSPRWCTLCLCDQLRAGKRAHRPLVWSLEFYRICTRHGIAMLDRCLACGSPQACIPSLPSVLHCSACEESMVVAPQDHVIAFDRVDNPFEVWCSVALEDLIAKREVLEAHGSLAQFRTNVKLLAGRLARGSRKALCHAVGLPIYALNGWVNKSERPSLASLLRLCYGVGAMPAAIFLPGILDCVSRAQPVLAPTGVRQIRPMLGYRQREAIERQLAVILCDESDNRMLAAVASQVGLSRHAIKYWFPKQCREIVRKNRMCEVRRLEARYRADHEFLREAFQRLLANGVYPGRRRINDELAFRKISLFRPDLFRAYEEMRAAVFER